MSFDRSIYLDRIAYRGPLTPSLDTLQQLQKQHLLTVPFENLDIHRNETIVLQKERIFRKIVGYQRGGFCYELNGLFYELLSSLGFNARRISARTRGADNTLGKEHDHLAIIVTIGEQEYLTDVGFGEFTFGPLLLSEGPEQLDERGVFRIIPYDEDYLQVQKQNGEEWAIEYAFTTQARSWDEFAGMCHYHQTDPASHFTKKKMITRPTENGRITLTADQLKITSGESIDEIQLASEASFNQLLKQYFGITLG